MLETLEKILAFEPFRASGKPDDDSVRSLLKGRLEELEGTAVELRDCIKRVGALSTTSSSTDQEPSAEIPGSGEAPATGVRRWRPA